MRRIIRFIKAIIRYIRFGQRVSIDMYINRLILCKECEHFSNTKWTCKKCGCFLDKKAKMSTEKCPNNKW